MYKKIKVLLNIEYFSIPQSILIYKCQNDNTIYLDNIKLPSEYKYYGYLNKNFIQFGIKDKHYLRNTEWDEVFETPRVLLSQGFNGKSGYYTENYIYDKAIRRSRSDLFQLDVSERTSTKILERSADILILANETNLYFWLPKTTLKSLSLLTGEYEWELDLEEYGEFRKVLGVVLNKLWVSLDCRINGIKQSTLISIDIHSGVKIDILQNLPIDAHQVELIEDKQTIVSMHGIISSHQKAISPFVEINALTGAIIKNTYSQSLYDANYKIGRWQYLDNKIYFDAAFDTINSTHIGILDYTTLELIWVTEVKDRQAGLRDLQVSSNKIYALDSGGTLHIFEKETNA